MKIRDAVMALYLAGMVGTVGYVGYKLFKNPMQVQIRKGELVPLEPKITIGDRKYQGVVRIEGMFDGRGMCSGSVISDSYILTAAHCVVDEDRELIKNEFRVTDVNHVETGVTAKAVAVDIVRDIALVKGNFSEFENIPFSTSLTPLEGTVVLSCGFPANGDLGCVPERIIGNVLFQYRAAGALIFQGDSGGPVLAGTAEGYKIIGVNSAVLGESGVLFGPIVQMEAVWKIPKN